MTEPVTFLDGKVTLYSGDCREVVAGLPDASIDSVVSDPPYALVSMTKARPDLEGKGNPYARKQSSRGFMGKQWDTGETAFAEEFWREILRVLKPGGHVVSFAGTRTYHRLACAVEDAGFEIRDQIGWAYGSGFPKSHNVGNGWGTALKPAWEPIVLARKPVIGTVAANVLAHGTGAINVDGCRVGLKDGEVLEMTRPARSPATDPLAPQTNRSDQPYQYRNDAGRWPANIIHDGSEEVLAAFPAEAGGGTPKAGGGNAISNVYGGYKIGRSTTGHNDSGSAARFFYSAKADADDRVGSKHPTVKPVDLMRYLCRLVTPPGGVILDPFAGTGTTGEAAFYEGFRAILIEREAEYQADIARRMKLVMAGPEERSRESAKARHAGKPADDGPLFGGSDTRGGQTDLRQVRRSIGPIGMTKW